MLHGFSLRDFTLFEELHPIPGQIGRNRLSILVRPSFKPSAFFDFYRDEASWKFYWIQEPTGQDLYTNAWLDGSGDAGRDMLACNEEPSAVRQAALAGARVVDGDIVAVLEALCERGLPAPKEIPAGLDGHEYCVYIDGVFETYECWCYLPEEWGALKRVIDASVEAARLTWKFYGARI